jgi:predicted nucleic acid-binding protein
LHQEVVTFHDGRIIPVNLDIAERAGRFLASARAAGFEPDTEDAWIAATADVHGMEVLTFNEADF